MSAETSTIKWASGANKHDWSFDTQSSSAQLTVACEVPAKAFDNDSKALFEQFICLIPKRSSSECLEA